MNPYVFSLLLFALFFILVFVILYFERTLK